VELPAGFCLPHPSRCRYKATLKRHYAEFREAVEACATMKKEQRKIATSKTKPKDKTAPSGSIDQLKITLLGSRPPIWRRVQVNGGISLARLHDVIQTVMGWTDSHLHCFRVEGVTFSSPDP
jgi:hypothetical protein